MRPPALPSLLLVAALGGGVVAQQRIYVHGGVVIPGDGSTWTNAFKTLQQGLAAAQPQSHVWVAAGTYTGGFAVPAGVRVLGGFQAGDLVETQRRPNANRTTLDGAAAQRVLVLGHQSVVDGFLVQNGMAPAPGGGGALADGAGAEVRNCIFRLNTNAAGRGSALLVRNGGDVRVENCILYLNGDPAGGHAVELDAGKGLLLNSVVHGNANDGIRFLNGSTAGIFNCVVAENTGRGITHESAADVPSLRNTLFHNNALGLYRHLGQDLTTLAQVNALAFAQGNVAGDPRFVSVGGNDFRLQAGSPCIDAGDAAAAVTPVLDYEGNSRLLDGNLDGGMAIDIGAHEFTNVTLAMQPHVGGGHFHPNLGGTPGTPYVLFLAAGRLAGLPVAPFGFWFLDPAVLLVTHTGVVPQTLTINVPTGTPTMLTYWQAFGAGPGGTGNLSNPVSLQIN